MAGWYYQLIDYYDIVVVCSVVMVDEQKMDYSLDYVAAVTYNWIVFLSLGLDGSDGDYVDPVLMIGVFDYWVVVVDEISLERNDVLQRTNNKIYKILLQSSYMYTV